jgi:sporulation protein YlmC with PRC-barrel domain
MAQHGMLRDYRFTDAAEDIRGSKLYGSNNEKLGKIDDVIFDHTSGVIRYVVVDTGGWLSTKKFLVPADRLRASAEHQDDFTVDVSKEQIEGFPPYDESHLESDDQFADYEGRYRSKWETGPVMHRAETDRNITPTAEQMAGNAVSERALGAPSRMSLASSSAPSGTVQSNNVDTGAFTEGGFASGTDSVVISQGANGIGPRWDRFQDRLRERRKEVISTGSTPESADKYRKAS